MTPTDTCRLRLSSKRDSLTNGYPLIISESSYPPQLNPEDSASQGVGALAAIGATIYARALEDSRAANALMAVSDRIGNAIDRYASLH